MQTCINGTLYSLLKKQKFKDEARRINLENKLKNFGSDNNQLQKQITYILEELNNPPEEEDDYDENFEEDINAKDEEENNFDEYAEADSIDGNLFEEHYKVLGDFIIRNMDLNKLEEEKIAKFMNNNPSMANVLVNNKGYNINSNMNNYNKNAEEDYDRPYRRPTTPMSNALGMTGNSQMFREKAGNKEQFDDGKFFPDDSAKAFMKKDKLIRTPPESREFKKN